MKKKELSFKKLEKYLPFFEHPKFITYQYLAFLFGIIQVKEETRPWLSCNFIWCDNFSFGDKDIWRIEQGVLQRELLFDSILSINKETTISEIQEQIEKGYYISGLYDEFYDPHKWAYGIEHNEHDFLLTGYDDFSESFISYGYIKGKKFRKYMIQYKDFINAFSSPMVESKAFRMRINPSFKFEFSWIGFLDELYRYIKQPLLVATEPINGYSGISTWKSMYIHIDNTINKKEMLDMQRLRFLVEHKLHILSCFDYIKTQFDILNDQSVLYSAFIEEMKVFFNLGLKYCIKRDVCILDKMMVLLLELFEKESEILNDALRIVLNYGGEILF
ncbi:MAG: hypothetical protein IJS45_01075 [Clostridia bacterium]|nr:hypothetical protein [Clostridia bacterium]